MVESESDQTNLGDVSLGGKLEFKHEKNMARLGFDKAVDEFDFTQPADKVGIKTMKGELEGSVGALSVI
jgi:hypothetical protein